MTHDDGDPAIRALVDRQARAWERNDAAAAVADWHPDGVLTAPGARVPLADLPAAMGAFHDGFTDLVVTVTSVFHSADRTRVAIEWLWEVTRRSDGARSTTEDAIIVDLDEGRIRSWREYFDPTGAVEAKAVG